MTSRPHHRPLTPGDAFFEAVEGGADPALVTEAAERAAALLVRGARGSEDQELIGRLVHLAEAEGLEALADLWAGSPAESLAGCLWRLYLVREWVHAQPLEASLQFDTGRRVAEVDHVVAGVADPPGPDEVRAMVDAVLRGIAETDFADVLLRAAAFAQVIAAGRAALEIASAGQMHALAEQLAEAARHELAGSLH
ncbi:hypothetical protein NODU109028_16370 [Nocardioides dubius]|uniref:DNA-directed RNA polymerase subunit beta n=1 Tax=Nocardioides dubius TaxID=317019 RepID=A0ABN1U181_9ACTN